MSYFVTGATGFIGRFLIEQLLEREGTIYVLCRESSRDRLDELRERAGAPTRAAIVPVIGDLVRRSASASRRADRAARTGRSTTSSTSPPSTT